MRIQFNGAVRNVTGSKHVIEVGGKRLLLDCGLYQGRRDESARKNRNLPFEASEIDAFVLSHAHIDHSGTIPILVRNGYKGRIFATPATVELAGHLLRDSANIQERDAEYLNKKKRKGDTLIVPLYTSEDVQAVYPLWERARYGQTFEPLPGVRATFYDAGHILGSAITLYELSEGDRRLHLLFTGDLGHANVPILRNPQNPGHADILVTESTYGGRLHEDEPKLLEGLRDAIESTRQRGGVLVIPAFSVGRTQVILYYIHKLLKAGKLQQMPIYVDSPLAISATETYTNHDDCFDSAARELLKSAQNIFSFPGVEFTRDQNESMAINHKSGFCVIIAASGMCEAGRVLHHLKHRLADARNMVLIVGWQAPNTLGRRLVEKEAEVRVLDNWIKVRAEIRIQNGFSAHADAQELEDFAMNVKGVKTSFLVHGELKAAEALKERFASRGRHEVVIPEEGQWYEI